VGNRSKSWPLPSRHPLDCAPFREVLVYAWSRKSVVWCGSVPPTAHPGGGCTSGECVDSMRGSRADRTGRSGRRKKRSSSWAPFGCTWGSSRSRWSKPTRAGRERARRVTYSRRVGRDTWRASVSWWRRRIARRRAFANSSGLAAATGTWAPFGSVETSRRSVMAMSKTSNAGSPSARSRRRRARTIRRP